MSRVDDALLLRDTIQRIVDDKLGKERPKSSYALVTGFNPDEGTVSVIFDGDDITVDIPAGSIYPSEIGQTVRVGGSSGAKVIEDVMGENLTEVKAREAQATADGKNTVNYGETPPEGTDHKDGDIWFDEGNSNMPNVWRDGQWVTIEDLRVSAIEAAQAELREDLDTVVENGVGTKSFYKPTQPTEAESKEGDLWFDTSEGGNNELHTYVNGAWVSAADARIAAIAQAQAELASDLEDVVTNGIGTKTFYKPTQPAVADSKEGDLWFDTSTAGKNALHVFTGGAWVSAADARLAELKTAQDTMTGDITAAQQKADEAFQNAADADSKAVTAQGAADAAASAAASAAGIANGKGKVLVQSTAPGAADRNAQTLWIDTTGGANTPKRWVSGTTWSAVTDKAATDAASAAANAQTKADEAKTAADAAQATATSAQTAASNAQSTATEALTSANSKNTVTRSTANPTTPYAGRVDDIWWKMSSLSSGGRVIGQYRWSGTAWLTETIDNAVIANLDAAKITTGYLAAARIKANTLDADTVLVNGSLGSIILRDGAITTPKIGVGAITAESGVVASLDAGTITVGTLDAARIAAASITADKMLVGQSQNMVPDPAFVDPSINAARITRSTPAGGTWSIADGLATYNPAGITGNASMALGASTDLYAWPAYAGMKLVAKVQAKARSGSSSIRMTVYVKRRSTTGYYSMIPSGFTTLTGSWAEYTATYTMPDDAIGFTVGLQVNSTSTGIIDFTAPYAASSVGSTLIEPGAITTEKIATGAITAQSGVIASLDAGKITVGEMEGARIKAQSIAADRVLIGSGAEMMPDEYGLSNQPWYGNFDGGAGTGWSAEAAYPGQSRGVVLAHKPTGTSNMSLYANTLHPDYQIPVQPGETYQVFTWVYATGPVSGFSSGVAMQVYGYDKGAYKTNTRAGDALTSFPSGQWIRVGGAWTAPAGIDKFTPRLTVYYPADATTNSAKFYIGRVSVKNQVGSTLIEPGAITTEKLAVGAITAESGVIGSLDASKITVGKLSGARLEADAINGMQIIGATIATSTGFPRAQMDTAGIAVYKSSSVRSFFADAVTGNLSIVGDFATGASGPRVEIKNDRWNNIQVIDADGSKNPANGSGIWIGSDDTYGFSIFHGAYDRVGSTGLQGQAANIKGPLGRAYLSLTDAGDAILNGEGTATSGRASISTTSGGQGQLNTYDSSNRLMARVLVTQDGAAGAQGFTSAGAQVSEVLAKRDMAALVFNPGKSNEQGVAVKSNGIYLLGTNVYGLPIVRGDGIEFPTVAANGGSQTVTVTFSSGAFSSAPGVSAMTSHGRVTPVVFNITKTGFSFRVWNFTSSSAQSVVGSFLAVGTS